MASRRYFRIFTIVLGTAFVLSLSGCERPARFFNELSQEWNALLIVLTGGVSPLAEHPRPKPSVRKLTPSQTAAEDKANSELLQEVLRVVYDREPQNRAQFGLLVNTLGQGASIEGLYNGFVHSDDYRQLEVTNPGSSPAALSFFAGELARTEVLLKKPRRFGPEDAKPLAPPVQPGVTHEEDFLGAQATPTPRPSYSVQQLESRYKALFAHSSIFTLKRVLGDELIELIDEKKSNPKDLQSWYGNWVVRMCAEHVDFGLALRNRPDAAFHARWAAKASVDRLKWEVLNRIHRILNAKNLEKAPGPQGGQP